MFILGLIAITILQHLIYYYIEVSHFLYMPSVTRQGASGRIEPNSEPDSYTMGDAMSKGFRDHGVGGCRIAGICMKGGQAVYSGGKAARKAFLKQSCKNMVRKANRNVEKNGEKSKSGANCDGVENQLTNCKQNMEDQLVKKIMLYKILKLSY